MPLNTFSLPDAALIRMKAPRRGNQSTVTVLAVTGLSATTIRRKVREGTFPRPVSVGLRGVRWRWGDVRDWLASRETAGADAREGE